MNRIARVLWLALVVAGCASMPLRFAEGPPDWTALSEQGTIELVTRDPDGDVRETTVWLAVVDGVGTIRTGDTRWFANLKRDPALRVRIAGSEYPMRVEMVADAEQSARLDAAFRAKYGFADRTVMLVRSPVHHMRLLPQAPR